MAQNDDLGTRMKKYEQATGTVLVQRMPAIIRVDGKAFHTWTKCLPSSDGPSELMHKLMIGTSVALCEQIQNAVIAYTQSDEISVMLRDYDKLNTQQWFDGNVQKIASVAAAIATQQFNHLVGTEPTELNSTTIPLFDARVFNVPKEDVANYFVWRQQDAVRNSINYIARQYFSHKQLHGKSKSDVQEMLFSQHGVNWNDYATWKRRGSCVTQSDRFVPYQRFGEPSNWSEESQIPIFTQDRQYIEQFVYGEGNE